MTYAVNSMITGGLFDGISSAFKSVAHGVESAAKTVAHEAKSAFHGAASFVHHPPAWFAVAMPLFTIENQRYLAGKIGGSTGQKIYDAGLGAVVSKTLGPEGPKLLEAYNKIADDASRGHADARAIVARAPQIAHLASASRQGPAALHTAILETHSHIPAPSGVVFGGASSSVVGGASPWMSLPWTSMGGPIESPMEGVFPPGHPFFVWICDCSGRSAFVSFCSLDQAIGFSQWRACSPHAGLAIFCVVDM